MNETIVLHVISSSLFLLHRLLVASNWSVEQKLDV